MNPIIENAYSILIKLAETSRDYIRAEAIRQLTNLDPGEIDDAVEYLVGQGALEVLRYSGTAPYGFYSARVTTPGRILYHKLKENQMKKNVSNKIKILFLSANPVTTTILRLDEEIREITAKIRASRYRDAIELVSVWAVRPDDLLQALNENKPQIVHFSGHASPTGEIVVVDSAGSPKAISTEAIKFLFRALKDNIRIVILNACYSRTQAEAIINQIDCAVGMKTAIGDQAAIIFAAAFYRAIGFGRSVQEAFDQAKTALLLEGIPEENTPELLVRSGINPSEIRLITEE